ncbi:MAG: CRISPR-associated endonuclease Cas1 [Anaerolineae bacterium]|jgi:CRISPR-associated protein Cas1|nr:CRISPR-associated endonuclease Cas1 [Anaerolineae bacterium]
MPVIRNLVVDEFGVHVGKHSERLQVMRLGEGTPSERMVVQAPLLHLESVVVTGRGISLSADTIEACTERGIPIFFLDSMGRHYAALYSAGLTGTVMTRRAQLAAVGADLDGEALARRGVAAALAFAEGKIRNQANLLRYMGKYRKEAAPEAYAAVEAGACQVLAHLEELPALAGACRVGDVRFQLLGIEGRAAQQYWAAVRQVLPAELSWPGRRGRGARDAVNSALNYGYGILYGQVERALVLAGLDPYGGLVHVDRPGKPSLVLDAIEEFRQAAVDRTVFGLVNRRVRLEQDERGMLTKETRRRLADEVLARLETPARYEKRRQPLRAIIQGQARHLATFLRGERSVYEPWVAAW